MSNFNTTRSTLTITTLVGLSALCFSALSAHADVTGRLNQCRMSTKDRVVSCCEQILKHEKKPMWMVESHDTCRSVAVCVGKKYGITYSRKPKCFIQIKFPETRQSTVTVPQKKRN